METGTHNTTGTEMLSDKVIATDLLMAAKTGIKSYARAISEAATPDVREALRHQMEESIVMHEKVTDYMMNKGWYHPYNVKEQLNLDMRSTEQAEQAATRNT